jgi:hypothetical protein
MTTSPQAPVKSDLEKEIRIVKRGIMITTAFSSVLGLAVLLFVSITAAQIAVRPGAEISSGSNIAVLVALLAFVITIQLRTSFMLNHTELVARRKH